MENTEHKTVVKLIQEAPVTVRYMWSVVRNLMLNRGGAGVGHLITFVRPMLGFWLILTNICCVLRRSYLKLTKFPFFGAQTFHKIYNCSTSPFPKLRLAENFKHELGIFEVDWPFQTQHGSLPNSREGWVGHFPESVVWFWKSVTTMILFVWVMRLRMSRSRPLRLQLLLKNRAIHTTVRCLLLYCNTDYCLLL